MSTSPAVWTDATPSVDRHVEAVREQLKQRAAVGLLKYGVTTERPDLTTVEWLRHAQQEALDLAVYLERLIADLEAGRDPNSVN